MVAIATPVPKATNSLDTLTPTAQASALGLPASLFGFNPTQRKYWYEPRLPFLTHKIWENAPLGYSGTKLIWCYAECGDNSMAPRFPRHCRVNIAPVFERKNLVVGKVYLYAYKDAVTGEECSQLGRLSEINDNYLVANFDNDPIPALWMLHSDKRKEVWNVYEVTHYVSYPGE